MLIKYSYGRLNWELPGGGEADESASETAIREVREETGLTVVAERITGVYYEADEDFHHFVFCAALSRRATFQSDEEITECAYWPLAQLPRPISDFTVRRIWEAVDAKALILPFTFSGREWLD